ncbi:glycosyltransferase family 2 protein [Hafnia alvei]|uniref:glycosyltransferase family 2 protein n=1 Tax=Hafnia alvei TaxID=569 RepID=UPI0040446554
MNINEQPLVSIIIVTFNSGRYIEETLSSCYHQSHENIEIIISDDASTDSTIDICQKWIEENDAKNKVFIVEADSNGGIPKNCNKGASVAKGQWLKFIGGDDILDENAIANLLNSVTDEVMLVLSNFKTMGLKKEKIYPYPYTRMIIDRRSTKKQFEKFDEWLFLLGFSNVAPGAMIKAECFNQMGKYDESFFLLEDLPMWYKVFKSNAGISFCENITVRYRVHEDQATGRKLSNLLVNDLEKYNKKFRRKFSIPYIHSKIQILSYSKSNFFLKKLKYFDVFEWGIFIFNKFKGK